MLFFTALQMYQSAIKTGKKGLMILTGILAFVSNIGIAFIVMFISYKGFSWFKSKN